MPANSGTSARLRAVLASLENLAEAASGTVRFRWEASPLGYAPLAGLAADPADLYHRQLKSATDRLFAPGVPPDSTRQPLPSRHPAWNAAQRSRGPAVPDAPLPDGKKDPDASAPGQGRAVFSAGLPSAATAMPDRDTHPAPPPEIQRERVTESVARILSRVAGHPQPASNSPVSEQATVLKENPGPAGALRRRPAETGVSHTGRTMRLDSVRSAADSGVKAPDAFERVVPDRQQPSAVTKQAIPFRPHRFETSDSYLPAVLGKTSMSRSGLAAPLKLERAVSADRLARWAYGGASAPIQHSGLRPPRPADGIPRFTEEHSGRGENLMRPRENTDPAPAEIRETGIPGVRSSLLGSLVSRWQQADKGPARLTPVRDLTPPQADAMPLPLEPSAPQWPLSAVSDMDFVRRLENVLLSESRRRGIFVEDQ